MSDIIQFGAAKSQVQQDAEGIEECLKLFDNSISAASISLNSALNKFWNYPDDRLLALLNAYGPVQVLGSDEAKAIGIPYDGPHVEGIFPAHEARAIALNEMRTKRGLPPLAEIGAKKHVTINPGTGLFEMVPEPLPYIDEEITPPAEG